MSMQLLKSKAKGYPYQGCECYTGNCKNGVLLFLPVAQCAWDWIIFKLKKSNLFLSYTEVQWVIQKWFFKKYLFSLCHLFTRTKLWFISSWKKRIYVLSPRHTIIRPEKTAVYSSEAKATFIWEEAISQRTSTLQ